MDAPNSPLIKKILYEQFAERVWKRRRVEFVKSFEMEVTIPSVQTLLNSMVIACEEDPSILGSNRRTLEQTLPVYVVRR
jgi:hypothetical protein